VIRRAAAIALLLAACGDDGGTADRSTDSPPAGPGVAEVGITATTGRTEVLGRRVDRPALSVGDCVVASVLEAGAAVDPGTVAEARCDEPHGEEVFAVLELGRAGDRAYPGDDQVAAEATEECTADFAAYVGASYERSALDFTFIVPGAEGWASGDRRVDCLLYHADFQALVGSMRATGL
jgi:hypothetical protein